MSSVKTVAVSIAEYRNCDKQIKIRIYKALY